MPDIFHYTCDDAVDRIDGLLIPKRHPMLGPIPIVWMTDLETPDALALGLTSNFVECDRTRYRYQILSPDDVEPWIGSLIHAGTEPWVQAALTKNAAPEHWLISTRPQQIAEAIRLEGHLH